MWKELGADVCSFFGSHGTHKKVVSQTWHPIPSPGSYKNYDYDPIIADVPNMTRFSKLLILGVLGLVGLCVRDCIKKDRALQERLQERMDKITRVREREMTVPVPYILNAYMDAKKNSPDGLEWEVCLEDPLGRREDYHLKIHGEAIKRAEETIDRYRREIKQKIEDGDLTPKHMYWKTYEKHFGNEEWWKALKIQQEQKGK